MFRFVRKVQRRLKERTENRRSLQLGQATTEYILILAVVVLLTVKFKTLITGKMEKIITDITGKIDTAVQDD